MSYLLDTNVISELHKGERANANVRAWFEGLEDRAISEEWGRLNVPDPLPVGDGLLAATAKVSGLTFATRNVSDVEGTGVELLDPFVSVS